MSKERSLIELNPSWFTIEGVHNGMPIALQFDCPVCPRGCHRLFVPFVDHVWNHPRPTWHKSGATFEDISLSPSIHYPAMPCQFHGYVTQGKVTW